jgi:hypothetical protein
MEETTMITLTNSRRFLAAFAVVAGLAIAPLFGAVSQAHASLPIGPVVPTIVATVHQDNSVSVYGNSFWPGDYVRIDVYKQGKVYATAFTHAAGANSIFPPSGTIYYTFPYLAPYQGCGGALAGPYTIQATDWGANGVTRYSNTVSVVTGVCLN